MLIGAFSPDGNVHPLADRIRIVSEYEGMRFHPVVRGNFAGGYYLHERLPYSAADYYLADESAGLLILLSGSLYNRAELLQYCDKAAPCPDPELISRLFQKDGADFVKRVNGDFAIFIGHLSERKAYLFRDHLGIRPMAYYYDHGVFFFSSDIMGLCRAVSGSREINSEYLLGSFKYIDYTLTPDSRVRKLLPGQYLKYSVNGLRQVKYWSPEKIRIDRTISSDKMVSDLRSLVNDAVRIRCDRRFTAGAHVSSGLDSGIISALVRKEYSRQDDFYGFSWSPGDFTPVDNRFDERRLVVRSCEKSDIKPLFSDMRGADFIRFVSAFYHNQGYISEHKTIEQARDLNVNLLFSGWGGDDFISTGDLGIDMDLLTGLRWRIFFRRNPVTGPKQFIRNFLYFILKPSLGIMDKGTVQSFMNDALHVKKSFRRSNAVALRNMYFYRSRQQRHLRLLRFYHIQERCESWAVNGFRSGVEYRYPLLDRRIVEYMLKVPSEAICRAGLFRPILRETGKGIIPEEVRLNQSKNDPVYWEYISELTGTAAVTFMDEVTGWKANRDLHFIDFELLEEDIRRYHKNHDKTDSDILFRSLVNIKAVHEFTKTYRSGCR
ncbi:MAG: asparagine synthase-related protein [Bacteroidales bacterium]|jgi:asparagine synthase (glutamine-hydrolysing)|nr:asparagine synthase-related protein [Bacteroidales bacterium]